VIDVEAVKREVSLVDLIGKTVKLTRHGDAHVGLCPFHVEKTPSFRVIEGKRFYYCHGCGATGDCFDWVMHADGVGFQEAAKKLGGGNVDGKEVRKRLAERAQAEAERLAADREAFAYSYLQAEWEDQQAARFMPEVRLLAERVRRFWR
jgi:DNA primase